MTLEELLKEKGMTRYRLAKDSQASTATVLDLCSGDIQIERCTADTVRRLARTLNITMEQLMDLEYPKEKKQKI